MRWFAHFRKMGVVADEVVCALQDTAGGAVVLLQFDQLQARKVLLQQGQILRARAAPGVHRLVIIPHGGEGPAHPHQLFHQLILAGIGVLILVHQEIAGAVLPAFQGLWMLAEKPYRQQDEVIEIHRVVGLEVMLVEGVKPCRRGFGLVSGPGEGLDLRHQRVLPTGYLGLQAGGDPVLLQSFLTQQLAQQGGPVLGIHDRKTGFVAELPVFPADDVEAQGVEGGYRQSPAVAILQQPRDPLFHLPGGLVGKGDGGDVARRNPARFDQIGDFPRDNPRFAGTRSGKHQQRAIDVADCFRLSGVQGRHGHI
jgi:hypothetical protein